MPRLNGIEKFVAMGNQDALLQAIHGDSTGALANVDTIRDEAILKEPDAEIRNEVECRRLEVILNIAETSGDWVLYAKTLREIGRSRRFSEERLHDLFEMVAAHIRDMNERPKQ